MENLYVTVTIKSPNDWKSKKSRNQPYESENNVIQISLMTGKPTSEWENRLNDLVAKER